MKPRFALGMLAASLLGLVSAPASAVSTTASGPTAQVAFQAYEARLKAARAAVEVARCGDLLEGLVRRRVPLDSEALARLLASACYSPARIEAELGWRAGMGLEAGLREMLHA